MNMKLISSHCVFLFLTVSSVAQNVGLGTNTPNGRLQFKNEIFNRIVVLNESGNNEHNFFGFGINEFTLRYQVADPAQSHVFFAGNAANATGSNELLRISGNGNIGIGYNNPRHPLSFPPLLGKKISLYPGIVGDAGFSIWGNELRIHSDNPNAAITFGVDSYNAPQFTERMRITGTGHVGIGLSNPTAPLQFAADTRNRKVVLWSVADNDHQFYGFGVNGFTLRYQTAANTDDHVFFSGAGINASTELFRIKGTGALGVAGNTGQSGQVLISNGSIASPSWAVAPGRYLQVIQSSDAVDAPGGALQFVPGLQATVQLDRAAVVIFHIRVHISVESCLACEPNLSYIILQRELPNGVIQNVAAFPVTTPVGKINSFSSGPVMFNLPAGQHVYRIALANQGPISDSRVTWGFLGTSNPGVLGWQIFPN